MNENYSFSNKIKPTSTKFENKSYENYIENTITQKENIDTNIKELHMGEFNLNREIIEDEFDKYFSHNITLNSIGSEDFKFKKKISVTVEQRDDEFIACLYEANLFGYGENTQEAISDLLEILIETFEFLHEQTKSSVEFGESVKKQFIVLNDLIEKRY